MPILSRELKIGIAGGLISSILVIIFIQPILSGVWNVVISFGESIQAGYVDRIYRNAALGERNLVGHLSFLLLAVVLNFVATSFLVEEIARHSKTDRHETLNKLSRIFFLGIGTLSLLAGAALTIAFSISSGVVEISASFNQRLTVMAPVINDLEYKQFRAQWAKMQGQKDYRTIVASMDKRANDLKVELPKVREP